MINPINTT